MGVGVSLHLHWKRVSCVTVTLGPTPTTSTVLSCPLTPSVSTILLPTTVTVSTSHRYRLVQGSSLAHPYDRSCPPVRLARCSGPPPPLGYESVG